MRDAQMPKGEDVAFSNNLYTIALLCGGASNEREVSLSSAVCVEEALSEAGHTIVKLDIAAPDFLYALKEAKPDVAFLALHGKGGEDGAVQGALELLGIPYTGSGILGSALAMDKHRSKVVYESLGLKTAPSLYLESRMGASCVSPERIVDELGLPVVVKPSGDGSSVGITIVKEKEALPKALEDAFAVGSCVLVEKFIAGTEITVSVIGGAVLRVLPAIEIVPKNEFYDYESKYAAKGSEHIIPARIDADVMAAASGAAIKAHEGLNCFGMSRTDMIVDEQNDIWIIETNTIPGMTPTSLLPDAARHIGINSRDLYELLISWALERAEQ